MLLGTYSILYDPQLCAYRLLNIWINFDMIDCISNTIKIDLNFKPTNILLWLVNHYLCKNTPLVSINVFLLHMRHKASEPHALSHIMRVFHVMYFQLHIWLCLKYYESQHEGGNPRFLNSVCCNIECFSTLAIDIYML